MKTVRVPLMIAPTELVAIDDIRFRERIASRAEAIRQLIERGLRASNPGARHEDADVGLPGKPAPSASATTAPEGQVE